jgi:hypothetical protein
MGIAVDTVATVVVTIATIVTAIMVVVIEAGGSPLLLVD